MLRGGGIDGLAHITGGGLTENIVRVLPDGLGIHVDTGSWKRPAVFDWLQSEGGIQEAEMLRTFNCGIGMVMLATPDKAGALMRQSAEHGIPCTDIGEVTVQDGWSRVEYDS
jgi:phosphoribosylformylglycinamidine cyclo-ligase